MSAEEHIAALKAKHRALDARIEEEAARPLPDEVALHQLKREKLRIKDEIAVKAHH